MSSPNSLTHRDLSKRSRRHCSSLPFCLVADAQLVGQVVAAVVTGLATVGAAAWAAFAGAHAANRNTQVLDDRARKTTDMDVARQMFAMACSPNDKESIAAAYVLKEMKSDLMSDPVLEKFVIRAVAAIIASDTQAYRRGATPQTTTPAPGSSPQAAATVGTT